MTDEDGNLVINNDPIINLWEQYIKELFRVTRPSQEPIIVNDSRPEILPIEIYLAIKQMKNRPRLSTIRVL